MITGAAGGFGKILATECAARGWNLLLTDNAPRTLPFFALGLTRMYGVTVQHFICNMTEPDSRASLWEFIRQHNMQFHMLINVAGMEYEGPFQERALQQIRTMLRLHGEALSENIRNILEFRNPNQLCA